MSKTDRGALLALGMALLAIVAVAWMGKSSDAQVGQPYTQEDQARDYQPLESAGIWETYTTPRDTIAQWVMAVLSVFATGASIVAVVMVGRSLGLTRRATEAAVAANNISKELFAAEGRPWLRLSRPTIRIDDNESAISFEVKAVNIGKTPALACEVHISASRTQSPVMNATAVEKFAASSIKSGAWKNNQKVIFPEKSRTVRPMGGGQIEEGATGSYVRVLYCVTYRASGINRVLRTAGEVLLNPDRIDGGNSIEGDWFLVDKFHSYGVAVAD